MEREVKKRDGEIYYRAGRYYYFGDGRLGDGRLGDGRQNIHIPDPKEGVRCFMKAVSLGHEKALEELKNIFNESLDVEKLKQYIKNQGVHYTFEEGSYKSLSFERFMEEVKEGIKNTEIEIDENVQNGDDEVERKEEKKIEEIKEKIEETKEKIAKVKKDKKDARIQFNAGCRYYNKKDLYNPQAAVRCFGEAANLGHGRAAYFLGFFCEHGYIAEENVVVVKKDLGKAVSWYAKSVRQGYKKALESLKRIYDSDSTAPDVKKNIEEKLIECIGCFSELDFPEFLTSFLEELCEKKEKEAKANSSVVKNGKKEEKKEKEEEGILENQCGRIEEEEKEEKQEEKGSFLTGFGRSLRNFLGNNSEYTSELEYNGDLKKLKEPLLEPLLGGSDEFDKNDDDQGYYNLDSEKKPLLSDNTGEEGFKCPSPVYHCYCGGIGHGC
jgi:TPR repeat protein